MEIASKHRYRYKGMATNLKVKEFRNVSRHETVRKNIVENACQVLTTTSLSLP